MTVGPMFGFEEVVDDSDLRTLGWFRNMSSVTGVGRVVGVPSVNGKPGRMIKATGAASTGSPGDGTDDFGLLPLSRTIRALWTAGGFSLNARLLLNAKQTHTYAGSAAISVSAAYYTQFVWDGARYWAIRAQPSANPELVYSTDLTTWTVAAWPTDARFSAANGGSYSISALAAGDIVIHYGVGSSVPAQSSNVGWRTTTFGASWTVLGAGVFDVSGGGNGCNAGYCTGSSTYPLLMAMNGKGLYYYNGTTWTANASTANASATLSLLKKVNGYIFAFNSNPLLMVTPATDAGIIGSVTNVTAPASVVYDVAYFGSRWVLSTSSGIYTNTSADPTTGTWSQIAATNGIALYQMAQSGTRLVAVGNTGSMFWSTDGATWSGGQYQRLNQTSLSNRVIRWTGTEFAVVNTLGVIGRSTDGLNWYPALVRDMVEGAVDSTNMFGLYCASAVNTGTGAVTLSSTSGLFVSVSAESGGNRTLTLYAQQNGTALMSTTVSNSPHFVELIGVATGTNNTFNVRMRVDGSDIAPAVQVVLGTATTDTTSTAVVNMLPRNGTANGVDDFAFVSFDGTVNTGPIGPCRIVPKRGATDVQAQWAKIGGAASNALSTTQVAQSVLDGNSVQSATAGQKDIYGLDSTAITMGVHAVQVSGYLNNTDASAAVVKLGIKSGSSENVGSDITVAAASPFYASQLYERDPATSALWTPSAAAAATPTITSAALPFSPSLLLFHFDGTNGQTANIRDASANNWLLSPSAGSTTGLDTSNPKWGTASLKTTPGTNWWSVQDASLDPGAGDFTIEFWLWQATNPGTFDPIVCINGAFNNTTYAGLFLCANGQIYAELNGAAGWDIGGASMGTLSGSVWRHIAFVRQGNVWTLYNNGAVASSTTIGGSLNTGAAGTMPGYIGIGGQGYGTSAFNIDDLRYNKTAIYTGTFTPPTGPFP